MSEQRPPPPPPRYVPTGLVVGPQQWVRVDPPRRRSP